MLMVFFPVVFSISEKAAFRALIAAMRSGDGASSCAGGSVLMMSPLTPELREFIDRAIVPALVKKYLAEMELAKTEHDAAHSVRSTAATLRVRP